MIEINGKSVYNSITEGKLYFYKRSENTVRRKKIDDPGSEILRFKNAKETAQKELDELYEKALGEVGSTNAQIFQIH